MVARAVTFRLQRRLPKAQLQIQTRVFCTVSTITRNSHPPLVFSIEPTTVSAISTVQAICSYSTLVREQPPTRNFRLEYAPTVLASGTFVESTWSPPAHRTRSKLHRSTPNPNTTPIHKHPISPSQASTSTALEDSLLASLDKLNGPICVFHTCSKLHRCVRAPPWPALCSLCGRIRTQKVRVCSTCGRVVCMDHVFLGFCSPNE